MSKPWFHPETGVLMLDQYVMEMPSFRAIYEDRVVSDEELVGQSERVVALLKQLEDELDPRLRELATSALCELAVLNALYVRRLSSPG